MSGASAYIPTVAELVPQLPPMLPVAPTAVDVPKAIFAVGILPPIKFNESYDCVKILEKSIIYFC